MKKLTGFLTIIALMVCFILPIGAANYPRVWDEADLLSDTDERTLITMLTNTSEVYSVDVVIVTVNNTGDSTPMEYADDFFDYNGYGFGDSRDGVLLLVSMEDRDWWISTRGFGITAFTDAGIEYIGDEIVTYLGADDYVGGFTRFAEMADEFIAAAKAGTPYDVGTMPKEPFNTAMALVIAVIVGVIVGKLYTGKLKGELKSVHAKAEAADYVKADSLNITESGDFFLYRRLDRRAKEKDSDNNRGGSSTHTSSSGASHGGGGGKF